MHAVDLPPENASVLGEVPAAVPQAHKPVMADLQDCGKGAEACIVPTAKQLLSQLPAFAARDRPAANRVLGDLLDR